MEVISLEDKIVIKFCYFIQQILSLRKEFDIYIFHLQVTDTCIAHSEGKIVTLKYDNFILFRITTSDDIM